MKIKNRLKIYYLIFAIGIFSLTTVGATYAYWVSSANSDNVISTNSISYSISMSISPLYHGFSFIPMDGEDTVKAIANGCKDKYDRGACSAYRINVYGYNEGLSFISGTINATTNIENLSYVIMAPKLIGEDSSKCASIEFGDEINSDIREYCLYNDYTKIENNVEQVLIDSYNVSSIRQVEFILIVWLENEERSQNEDGIGSFTASVTISAGSGGKIQGVITDAIEIDRL